MINPCLYLSGIIPKPITYPAGSCFSWAIGQEQGLERKYEKFSELAGEREVEVMSKLAGLRFRWRS